MGKEIVFRCPCCGQISPIARLEESEPYKAELFLKEFGGKKRLTLEDRRERHGKSYSGSASGIIKYTSLTSDEELSQLGKQLKQKIMKLAKEIEKIKEWQKLPDK